MDLLSPGVSLAPWSQNPLAATCDLLRRPTSSERFLGICHIAPWHWNIFLGGVFKYSVANLAQAYGEQSRLWPLGILVTTLREDLGRISKMYKVLHYEVGSYCSGFAS